MRARASLVMIVAAVLLAACGGSSDRPTPTPTPTSTIAAIQQPPATSTIAANSPTPSPTLRPTAPLAFVVRRLPPGSVVEDIETGFIFMDTATGELELVSLERDGGLEAQYAVSPDNRFVYGSHEGEALLLDRERSVVWSNDDLPGRPVKGGGGLLALHGYLLFETDVLGQVAVFDADLNQVWEFEIERDYVTEAWRFWPLQSGAGAVILAARTHSFVDIESRTVTQLPSGDSEDRTSVQILEDGFAFIKHPLWDGRGLAQPCIVEVYAWPNVLQSTVSLNQCLSGRYGHDPSVSPNGELIVTWIPVQTAESGGIGTFTQLSSLYVRSASTGQPLFRVMGALLPTGFVHPLTYWLADSSALVAETRGGNVLIDRDGKWVAEDLPGRVPFLAPQNTSLIAVGYSGGVWDRDRSELNGLSHTISIVPTYPWGIDDSETRYLVSSTGKDGGWPSPAVAPAIQFPPFTAEDDRLLVRSGGDCLNIRRQPNIDAEIVACVADGSQLEPHPLSTGTVERFDEVARTASYMTTTLWFWDACGEDFTGSCVWVSVQTPSGQIGWAFAEYLRWPGISPPEAD